MRRVSLLLDSPSRGADRLRRLACLSVLFVCCLSTVVTRVSARSFRYPSDADVVDDIERLDALRDYKFTVSAEKKAAASLLTGERVHTRRIDGDGDGDGNGGGDGHGGRRLLHAGPGHKHNAGKAPRTQWHPFSMGVNVNEKDGTKAPEWLQRHVTFEHPVATPVRSATVAM
jgi:hypothetical protein